MNEGESGRFSFTSFLFRDLHTNVLNVYVNRKVFSVNVFQVTQVTDD